MGNREPIFLSFNPTIFLSFKEKVKGNKRTSDKIYSVLQHINFITCPLIAENHLKTYLILPINR